MSKALLCVWFVGLCGAGCASTDAQLRVLEQARKGLATVAQAESNRQQLIDSLQSVRRQQLDAAFDDDVRAQATLTPDWVIEARQAYAVGLDALHQQRLASQQADQAIQSNLQSIDAALQRLQSIQSLYAQWAQELSQ